MFVLLTVQGRSGDKTIQKNDEKRKRELLDAELQQLKEETATALLTKDQQVRVLNEELKNLKKQKDYQYKKHAELAKKDWQVKELNEQLELLKQQEILQVLKNDTISAKLAVKDAKIRVLKEELELLKQHASSKCCHCKQANDAIPLCVDIDSSNDDE